MAKKIASKWDKFVDLTLEEEASRLRGVGAPEERGRPARAAEIDAHAARLAGRSPVMN
jgi:hypothetical protein